MKTKIKSFLALLISMVIMFNMVPPISIMSNAADQIIQYITDTDRFAMAMYARDVTKYPSLKRSWETSDCASGSLNSMFAAGGITFDYNEDVPSTQQLWFHREGTNSGSGYSSTWINAEDQRSYFERHRTVRDDGTAGVQSGLVTELIAHFGTGTDSTYSPVRNRADTAPYATSTTNNLAYSVRANYNNSISPNSIKNGDVIFFRYKWDDPCVNTGANRGTAARDFHHVAVVTNIYPTASPTVQMTDAQRDTAHIPSETDETRNLYNVIFASHSSGGQVGFWRWYGSKNGSTANPPSLSDPSATYANTGGDPVVEIYIYRIVGYYTDPVNVTDETPKIVPGQYASGSVYLMSNRSVSSTGDGFDRSGDYTQGYYNNPLNGPYSSAAGGAFVSAASSNYRIVIQPYEEQGGGDFGYCTNFERYFNASGKNYEAIPPSIQGNDLKRLQKAICYGMSSKDDTSSFTDLGVNNAAEAYYVTQMGVWYALKDLPLGTAENDLPAAHQNKLWANSLTVSGGGTIYEGISTSNRFQITANTLDQDSTAANRVLQATKALFYKIDDAAFDLPGSAFPPEINIQVTAAAKKLKYNALLDAYVSGPYTVQLTAGDVDTYSLEFTGTTSPGVSFISGITGTPVTYGSGQSLDLSTQNTFYIKVPKALVQTGSGHAEAHFKAMTPPVELLPGIVEYKAETKSLQGIVFLGEAVGEAEDDEEFEEDSKGALEVVKTLDPYERPNDSARLAGFQFFYEGLDTWNINESGYLLTGNDGKALISGLTPGRYKITETSVKSGTGYGPYDTPAAQEVTVVGYISTETVIPASVIMHNATQKGRFYIQKKIENEILEECNGFTFNYERVGPESPLQNNSSGQVTTQLTGGVNGVAGSPLLPPGTYKISEVRDKGSTYNYAPDQNITVTAGQTTMVSGNTFTFNNTRATGGFYIQKKIDGNAPYGTDHKFDGFNFEYWLQTDGTLNRPADPLKISAVTTPADGTGKVSVTGLMPGTYVVKEIYTGKAYTIQSTNPDTVEVQAGNGSAMPTVTFNNKTNPGSLFIDKVITGKTGNPSSGFTFKCWPAPAAAPVPTSIPSTVSGTSNTIPDGGRAVISDLEPGYYWVMEVDDHGLTYLLPSAVRVLVTAGETDPVTSGPAANTVQMTNAEKPGGFTITKSVTNPLSGDTLAGFQFRIYKDSACTQEVRNGVSGVTVNQWNSIAGYDGISGYAVTDTTGIIKVDGLPSGTYYVKEIFPDDSKSNYKVLAVNTVSVIVTAGVSSTDAGHSNVQIANTKKLGKLTITKTLSSGTSSDNAIFTVTGPDGYNNTNVVVTPGNSVTLDNLKLGTYYVKETTAPGGYLADKTTYEINLTASNTTASVGADFITYEKVITDDQQLGRFKIIKKDSKSNNPLNGAVFHIYPSVGSYTAGAANCDEVTILSGGYAYTKYLPLGEYKILEITAPSGYLLKASAEEKELEYNKTLANSADADRNVELEVTIENDPQMGKIRIVKKDGEAVPNAMNSNMEGAVFHIYPDGGTYVEGAVNCQKITIDSSHVSDGFAESKYLPLGAYIVEEVKAPDGYLLSAPASKTVTLSPQAGITTVEEYTPKTEEFINYKQRGVIHVHKSSSDPGKTDGNPNYSLEGAVFEIYPVEKDPAGTLEINGEKYTAGAKLAVTITTGADGKGSSVPISLGLYVIKESTASEGFKINTNINELITLDYAEGGAVEYSEYTVNVEEEPQFGKIVIQKASSKDSVSDANTSVYSLDNAKFDVYKAKADAFGVAQKDGSGHVLTDGAAIGTITTDVYGKGSIEDLPLGTYVLKETLTPNGFLIDEELRDYGVDVTIKYTKDTEGVPINYVTADKTIYNEPQECVIKLEKKNASSSISLTAGIYELSGAVFHIYPANTNYSDFNKNLVNCAEITTDSTGKATSKHLPLGEYIIKEVTASNGFKLNTSIANVTLVYDSAEALIEVTREVLEEPQEGKFEIIKMNYHSGKMDDLMIGAEIAVYSREYASYDDALTAGAFAAGSLKGDYIVISQSHIDQYKLTGSGVLTKALPLGDYYIEEIKAPPAFERNTTQYERSLIYKTEKNGLLEEPIDLVLETHTIDNSHQMIKLTIEKEMEELLGTSDGFNPIEDVVFGLYLREDILGADGKTVLFEKDKLLVEIPYAEGKFEFEGEFPENGLYYVKELRTNFYYKLDTNNYDAGFVKKIGNVYVFAVTDNGNPISNKLKEIKISIHKNGEVLTGFITDTIDGETVVIPAYETVSLKGAEFEIRAAEEIKYDGKTIFNSNDLVDTLVTAASGAAWSKPMIPGNYIIKETKAPEGFSLMAKQIQVNLNDNDELALVKVLAPEDELANPIYLNDAAVELLEFEVNVTDKRQKPEIILTKNAEIPDPQSYKLPEGYNPYSEISFGLYTDEEIVISKGTSIAADSLLEVVLFDNKGNGVIKSDLPFGKYYFRELKTAEGYELDETTKYPFEFSLKTTAKNSEKETFAVDVKDAKGKTIENKLQKGNLKLVKTFNNTFINEEKFIENIAFRITGTSITGAIYDKVHYTNKKGEINIEGLLTGSYSAQELEEENYDLIKGWKIAAAANFDIETDETSDVSIENVPEYGRLKLKKTLETVENQNDKVLDGIAFRLAGISDIGETIDIVDYTDKNGEIDFASPDEIPVGIYTITELPEESGGRTIGYEIVSPEYITVKADRTETITVDNKLQRGKLRIEKSFIKPMPDGEDPVIIVKEDIPFLIKGTSDAGVVYEETLYTDKNGIIEINSLPTGTYLVYEEESELSKGYELVPETEIVVEPDKTVIAKIENTLKHAPLKIVKTFEERTDAIKGVEFKVTSLKTDSGVECSRQGAIDENGVLIFECLPLGEYRLEEIKSPLANGYVLAKPQIVVLTEDDFQSAQVTQIDINNPLERGSLKIIKTFEGRTEPVKGVKFSLSGVTTAGVADYTNKMFETDENGEINIDNLPVGTYTVTEYPGEKTFGYEIAEAQNVTVTANQLAKTTFNNKIQRMKIHIEKVFVKYNREGESVEFTKKDVPFIIEGTSDIGIKFGPETFKTDENGIIEIDNLPVGTYYAREQESDQSKGYLLVPETKIVSAADNTDLAGGKNIVSVKITNLPLTRGFEVLKTFEASDPKAGILFRMTPVQTDAAVEDYYEASTGINGIAVFYNLPLGTYKLEEMESTLPKGYVLAEPKTIEITGAESSSGSVDSLKVTLHNPIERGRLKIIKAFEGVETPEDLAALAQIPFVVEGKPIIGDPYYKTVYTDKKGVIELNDLPSGDYKVREQENEIAYMFSIASERTVTISADELVEVHIQNKLVLGEVKVQKFGSDNLKKPLPGAKFNVYEDVDKTGIFVESTVRLVGTMTEGENAVHRLGNLKCGMYFVKEAEPPEEYEIDPSAYSFKISRTQPNAVVENLKDIGFVNSAIPKPSTQPNTQLSTQVNKPTEQAPVSPQTSDARNMSRWILLMVLSMAGLSIIIVNPKDKQKDKTAGGSEEE